MPLRPNISMRWRNDRCWRSPCHHGASLESYTKSLSVVWEPFWRGYLHHPNARHNIIAINCSIFRQSNPIRWSTFVGSRLSGTPLLGGLCKLAFVSPNQWTWSIQTPEVNWILQEILWKTWSQENTEQKKKTGKGRTQEVGQAWLTWPSHYPQ